MRLADHDDQTLLVKDNELFAALLSEGGTAKPEKGLDLVRASFEWLFQSFGQFEFYVRQRLVSFKDVEPHFRWYARRMARRRKDFQAFMEANDYPNALKFLNRFKDWEQAEADQ